MYIPMQLPARWMMALSNQGVLGVYWKLIVYMGAFSFYNMLKSELLEFFSPGAKWRL
jgi:hypothetical protein